MCRITQQLKQRLAPYTTDLIIPSIMLVVGLFVLWAMQSMLYDFDGVTNEKVYVDAIAFAMWMFTVYGGMVVFASLQLFKIIRKIVRDA